MIDHLIRFSSEADLLSLGIIVPKDEDGNEISFAHRVGAAPVTVFYDSQPVTLLAIKIINQRAEYDDEGALLTPEVVATGTWVAVRASNEITEWQSDPRLVTVTDDRLANEGAPFVLYKNSAYPWSALTGEVVPTFAGSHYPFGPDMTEAMLVQT